MDKKEFLRCLEEHDLTINMFLDLKEAWERLPAADRVSILKENKEEDDDYRNKNAIHTESKPVINSEWIDGYVMLR